VIGVDINKEKVHTINQGKSPIIEPGLEELIRQAVMKGRLMATAHAEHAIAQADVVLVCVGTPSNPDGSLNLEYIMRVCEDIGLGLRARNDYVTVAIRSTVLPGVPSDCLMPLIEDRSSKRAGVDFGFCVNPEFLREGTAIRDFSNPPFTVIGQLDEESGDGLIELYRDVEAPIYRLSLGAAEMIKYASNAFHALKVVFANEIGNLAHHHGVDGHEVMNVFVQDTQLNVSDAYLKPGFAFGGSCLPKDLRAMLASARQRSIRLPVLESILPSNQLQIEKVLDMLVEGGRRSVGLIGLSFKPDTDDLRESPAVELAERLLGKGFDLHIYDREVSLSQLHGSNRRFIEETIPHIASLLRPTLEETIRSSQSLIVTKRMSATELSSLLSLLTPEQSVIDLVRINGDAITTLGGAYQGICW
jgi:GDP-mannose 6-dehydrogenase